MTTEIALISAVLAFTIVLFTAEWLRVAVAAIVVMVSLAWLGLVQPAQAVGFAASLTAEHRCGFSVRQDRITLSWHSEGVLL